MAIEDSDEIEIDDLNKKIIKMVVDSKKPLSISQVVKPFLAEKSNRQLRYRVDKLALAGFLRRKEYPGCVLVTATPKGRVVASGGP